MDPRPQNLSGSRPPPADAAPEQRPGVPMQTGPSPLPGAEQALSDRQRSDVEILLHSERQERPIVYGTAHPPEGFNGAIRRLAYRYPDHMARKWLFLMLADQVAVRGAQLRKLLPVAAGATALGLLAGGVLRARRS